MGDRTGQNDPMNKPLFTRALFRWLLEPLLTMALVVFATTAIAQPF